MEEEVDLREYISVLIRRWRLIAGWMLLPALVTFGASSLLPKKYAASAIVAAAEPRYTLKFDPRIESVAPQVDIGAYLGLTTCDEIVMKLLQSPSVAPLLDGIRDIEDLREKLDTSTEEDESLVVLEVTDTDPERAAELANLWAELYVDFISEIYGQSQMNQSFFQTQLVEVDERLKRAEDALVAYQAVNPGRVFERNLAAKLDALEGYLHAEQSLEMLIRDAKSLRTRISLRKQGAEPNLADDLTALMLELNSLSRSSIPRTQSSALGASSEVKVVLMDSGGNTLPFQLQLPGGAVGLSGKTASEQVPYMDELVGVLVAKSAELRSAAKALRPEILSLQEQFAAASIKRDRVEIGRNLARDAFMSVARKSEEAGIAAASKSSEMRMASRASVPTRHVSPKRMLNTALAGMLGLMMGAFMVVVRERWSGAMTPVPEEMASKSPGEPD